MTSSRPSTSLLLVEDSPGDARLLREMFDEQGSENLEVSYAKSMSEAETLLAAHPIDIIVLDLGLPDAQGLDAVKRARTAAPRTPLVVLTGRDDESLATLTLQEGAQDYLIKGQIDSRGFMRALRYSIERKNMEEARRTADAALRSSEAKLRRLLESNIIGVAFWNKAGLILNANELFMRMIGCTRDDIRCPKLSWTDMIPPEYSSVFDKARAEIESTGSCAPFETELIRMAGDRITVLVGSALLEDESDSGTSFVMDITARRHAEEAMRLQGVALNAADNAMAITARDLSIVWINRAFTELTGFGEDEAIGRRPEDLLRSGVHDEAFYDNIRQTLLAGESWSGELTSRRKDGRLYPECQTITPVKDRDGSINHFISIKTDLTAQRLMEAKLRHGQKMEAVGQLAAGVAHEFNNLLQALMSMAAIVRLRGGTPDVARIGTEMEFQIKRGASLTQQLLLFSRHHALEKSALNLAEQIQKAGLLLRRLIQENIKMVVETSAERLSADGDPEQIQQVILNLAINARDAMPTGGTLTLRAGSSEGAVFLEVEDTGHGLDDATRAHLFEPFFTTKELGKGTGLGLAVVHGIVEQHGGRIEVHSRIGEGSRFRVILPATVWAAAPAHHPNIAPVDLPGSGRVLLVEDEEAVREGITALLEMIGYEVIAVGSGEEAIAMVLPRAPDLLLSDITLPGITGSAMAEQLIVRWPALKIVLMSGYLEEALRANAIERGWHFLQKPFEMADLTSHLREALGEPASSRKRLQSTAAGNALPP